MGPTAAQHPIVRVVACGSVDDGKSTLIGRLLAQTDSVPDDILDYARTTRRSGSTIPKGEVDYSMLTDGLEAEHEQGITIDVAYRHLYLPSGRRAIIADAPGHEQYTRNMAVAASTADVAVLLVDAARGIRAQTHRHLTVCALMGVRTVIVAINKMDAVDFRHVAYEELAGGVRAAAARFDLDEVTVIPVSALTGDNVIERTSTMPWYHGPSVLETLAAWQPSPVADDQVAPFRLPVQYIVRADNFRGYAGTVVAGSVRPGDKVSVNATGAPATVERIVTYDGDLEEAHAGTAVTLTLETETDVTRGDLLVAQPDASGERDFPRPASAFAADLVWTGTEELRHGRSYLLVAGSLAVPAVVTAIRNRRDVVSGEEMAARTLKMNDMGHVEIATDTAIPLDAYSLSRDTGGFLLVERVSRDTVAAGLTRHALRRAHNVVPHSFSVDRDARARLKGQKPRVLWLTGLPGAGKSTIADALERRLHGLGLHTYVLDGDGVRTGLNKDLGFTPEDRAENVRRVAETAKLMLDAGLIVVVSLVSPFRGDRRAAKALFADGDFVEVWVDTPADVVVERDPKGLYAKAKAGTLPNMTGVGQGYEPPEHPDLVVKGAGEVDDAVDLLIGALEVTH
ncbi:MAG: bifunctional enzyme CysN/CysC [Actinomycetota bacterium]|jgi:bifunctional enzyme CysN/CysC|nr:bifunctional enzyme CysN/CysC [Actinomycetota bacterium]